jgi:penicillin-binding protein 1A
MSTFVNDGIYTKPQFITKIIDKKGNVIYEQFPESKDAMSPDVAQAVIKLMEGVTEDKGTSARLRGGQYAFSNPIAGKTGTTNNNSDGWFIGMVPNLCAGAWVGCEDRSARFWSTGQGQGAEQALPIWGKFMKKCYNDKTLKISKEEFKVMEKPTIRVDCSRRVRDTTSFDQKIDEFNYKVVKDFIELFIKLNNREPMEFEIFDNLKEKMDISIITKILEENKSLLLKNNENSVKISDEDEGSIV